MCRFLAIFLNSEILEKSLYLLKKGYLIGKIERYTKNIVWKIKNKSLIFKVWAKGLIWLLLIWGISFFWCIFHIQSTAFFLSTSVHLETDINWKLNVCRKSGQKNFHSPVQPQCVFMALKIVCVNVKNDLFCHINKASWRNPI